MPAARNLKLIETLEENAVDSTLFKQIVGSLKFICYSRPGISYAFGLIRRFTCNPRVSHMATTKHILRYIKETTGYDLLFPVSLNEFEDCLEAWSDSDWCGGKVGRKSTYGYFFQISESINFLVF